MASLARVERILNVLGVEASLAQLQGNPAPMERIRQAEQGEEYHIDNERQLTLF